MRAHALFDRHHVVAAAAVVGAHAQAGTEFFRQRDVRFLFELFLNWTEHGGGFRDLQVQNTQVARWLDSIASEGFARRVERGKQPRYRLTRGGLLEMLGRMAREPHHDRLERFFFVHFFLATYRDLITDLVRGEGAQFPYAMQIELDELLDTGRLCERQIEAAERELERLEARIRDSLGSSALVRKMVRAGNKAGDIVNSVERDFPYELNSQKPLSDIAQEMTAERLCWELDVGAVQRSELIFAPAKRSLETYISSVRDVARKAGTPRVNTRTGKGKHD